MAATYTVKQVANILGYSTNSIYSFLKEKRIEGVRVGKGRFRIPESELNRLLLTKKQPTAQIPQELTISTTPGVQDVVGNAPIERTRLFGYVPLGTLNIFDWFIGTAAAVSGMALFLFNTTIGPTELAKHPDIVSALKAFLIGGGLGLIITNITGDTRGVWHKLFHILLGTIGIVAAVTFWVRGDIDGMFLYGIMSILVLFSSFIHLGGVAWVTWYMTLLTIATILTFIFSARNPHISSLLAVIPWSMDVFISMMIIAGILYIFALWFGYYKSKPIFWITTWIGAFLYFIIAFWYATDQYWSRSFFLLVLGMSCLFLSPWEWLAQIKSRKADLFTLSVFGAIFIILIIGVGGVYMMQTNVIATVKRENAYKVNFARNDLEKVIESVHTTIKGAASTPEFVTAVTNKDIAVLNNFERIMYESNNTIRRLVVIDVNGQGVNMYPFGTFDNADLSFRDYYLHAHDTGGLYVSDLYTAAADQSSRQVVSASIPIYDNEQNFVGVLLASLDLSSLTARLQQIAVPERGESIMVVDSKGRRILHQDSTQMGTVAPSDDPVYLGLSGEKGISLGSTFDGKPSVVGYEPVNISSTHWGIAMKTPLSGVYKLTETTDVTLFGIIITAVIIAGFILQGGFFLRFRRPPSTGGSP